MLVAFIRLLRFPNLIIVGLTQYLLRFCILEPYYQSHNITPSLTSFEFFLLVFTTIIIAGAGYIVNDLYDYEIDKINKPDKQIIGNQISKAVAWRWYYILNMLGLGIAVFVAWRVENLPLVLLFPLFAVPLWLYSYHLKKVALLGNLLIAIFCAMVAVLVLFAEREAYGQLLQVSPTSATYVYFIFLGYANFAFYSTMFREIVKDMEDVSGDQQHNCKTLPIVLGIRKTRFIAAVFGLILLGFLFYLAYWHWLYSDFLMVGLLYLIIGIILPLLYALGRLAMAKDAGGFARVSAVAKWVMLSGILYLGIYWMMG